MRSAIGDNGGVRVILEGLTGTGKSSTLAAMGRLGLLPPLVVPEEETFGDFMTELEAGNADLGRLDAVAARALTAPAFLLERFHLSYYALLPGWDRYAALDARLAEAGVRGVLLTVDDALLRGRSLMRAEYNSTDWQGFADHFGSEGAALEALRASQARRVEGLAKSAMRWTHIDTSAKDWDAVARAVAGAGVETA